MGSIVTLITEEIVSKFPGNPPGSNYTVHCSEIFHRQFYDNFLEGKYMIGQMPEIKDFSSKIAYLLPQVGYLTLIPDQDQGYKIIKTN